MISRDTAVAAFILMLAAPWILLADHVGVPEYPAWNGIAPILFRSGLQAALSAVIAMVMGSVAALGLCSIRNPRVLLFAEVFCLIPTWLPPLFVVLALLNGFTRFAHFPYGMEGVILVHVVMTLGLVAASLSRLVRSRLGRQIELGLVEGASKWLFLRRGLWPQIRGEAMWLGLVIFGFCFTSFSVPLLVGGGHATSLEIYIYQQLKMGSGFSAVLGIGFIEWALLMVLAQPTLVARATPRQEIASLKLIAWRPALLVPGLLSLLVLVGGGWSGPLGFEQFRAWPELRGAVPLAAAVSAVIGVLTGLAVALLVAVAAILSPQRALRWFLLSSSSPTTVVVGASLLLIGPDSGVGLILKLVFGLSILFLPPLFRLIGVSAIEALVDQVNVARVLGASSWMVGTRIVLPQISLELGWIAALGGLWAVGDFSLSRIVLSEDLSLSLVIQTMMSSYRLDLASWLMLILIGVGGAVASVFLGAGYVAHRKFAS